MNKANTKFLVFILMLIWGVLRADPTYATDYGVYPNCIAPAIGIESQAWWDEKDSPLAGFDNDPNLPRDERLMSRFRHVHVGFCAPNARDNSGGSLNVRGVQDFVAVVILHNNPGFMNRVAMKLWGGDDSRVFVRNHPSLQWTEQSGTCTGGEMSCVFFNPPLSCPERQTCRFEIRMRIHLAPGGGNCSGGVCELRLRPNLTTIQPRGDRQFTTNNAQVYVGGRGHYRSTPMPIARGWYTGLEYANARIDNYVDLFDGRIDITVPIVRGTIQLEVDHAEGGGSDVRSIMRINPNVHMDDPGILVYDEPGNYEDTIFLDTTQLPNGRNAIVMSTQEDNEFGTNIGLIKLFIDVQNGASGSTPPGPPTGVRMF